MDPFGRRIVVDLPFGVAVLATVRALEHEGLTVVNRVDVRDFLRRTLKHDFRRYALLQVTSPDVMFEALQQNLAIGTMVPTTVAIFELADGETAVVLAEPFMGIATDPHWRRAAPALTSLADRTCEQLARAAEGLEQSAHAGSRASSAALASTA